MIDVKEYIKALSFPISDDSFTRGFNLGINAAIELIELNEKWEKETMEALDRINRIQENNERL